jgi:hypothetical protein
MRIRNEANLFPQNLHFFQRKGDDDDDDDDDALPQTHRRRRRREEESKEDDDASCCSRKGYFFVGKRGRRGEEEETKLDDDDDDDDDELERILRGVFQISSGRAERGWHRRWRKKKRFDRTDDKVRAELQLSRRRAVGFVFSEQWVALVNSRACTIIIRGRRLAKRDDEMDLEQHHVNNSITTTHFARSLRGSGGGFGNEEFFFLFFLARGVAGRVAFLGVVVFEIRVG